MINLSYYRAVTKTLQFNYNFQHKKRPDFGREKLLYKCKAPDFSGALHKEEFYYKFIGLLLICNYNIR